MQDPETDCCTIHWWMVCRLILNLKRKQISTTLKICIHFSRNKIQCKRRICNRISAATAFKQPGVALMLTLYVLYRTQRHGKVITRSSWAHGYFFWVVMPALHSETSGSNQIYMSSFYFFVIIKSVWGKIFGLLLSWGSHIFSSKLWCCNLAYPFLYGDFGVVNAKFILFACSLIKIHITFNNDSVSRPIIYLAFTRV